MKSKYKIEDYLGKTINSWTVLSFSHTDSKSQQYWNCKCKCGKEKAIRVSQLIRHISKGCSNCRFQANSSIDSPYWKGGKFISSSLYTSIKLCAEKRNIDFKISIEDMENQFIFQKGKCRYTGVDLNFPKNYRDKIFTASLDRIDSSIGYYPNNIQWVLKDINLMKMDLKEERFLELCEKVNNYGEILRLSGIC